MNQPSNTPPDGDFVRYVEQLTAANAAAVLRQAQPVAPAPPRATGSLQQAPRAGAGPVRARESAPAATTTGLPALTGAVILGHVRWVVGIWIALHLLSTFVPAVGWLLVPALLAYAGWAVVSFNRDSSGALFARLREYAEKAAEEARKAQQNPNRK